MAIVGATQFAVVIPNLLARVRPTAEHDHGNLDQVLDADLERVHMMSAPALPQGRDIGVTPSRACGHLAAILPPDP